MNELCRESIKIAKLGTNQIEELLTTFEAIANENSQITADYDINLTASYSTHRIEVTVYHCVDCREELVKGDADEWTCENLFCESYMEEMKEVAE